MLKKIIEEFRSGEKLANLSVRYQIEIKELKIYIKKELGHKNYLRIIHSNGAKAVNRKLMDPTYRTDYVSKMSMNVKNSLRKLMRKPSFRTKWIKKSQRGSTKGTQQILKLLKDDEFYKNWCIKCKLGGIKVAERQLGFHGAPSSLRRKWSLAALKRIFKRSVGPKGERMYNWLEVYVASSIQSAGFDYTYEKIFKVENRNGYVSVDFVIKQNPNLLIEATCWDKPKQKSDELNRKLYLIEKKFPNVKLIVVTTRNRAEDYARHLRKDIKVLTPTQFRRFVLSKLAG